MQLESLTSKKRLKRHEVLMMSDLQSGVEKMLYVTDADATALEAENDRLRELVSFPALTPDAPTDQFERILRDHEKGCPVNGRDLVNALAWRVQNQRRVIARLEKTVQRYAEAMEDDGNV